MVATTTELSRLFRVFILHQRLKRVRLAQSLAYGLELCVEICRYTFNITHPIWGMLLLLPCIIKRVLLHARRAILARALERSVLLPLIHLSFPFSPLSSSLPNTQKKKKHHV